MVHFDAFSSTQSTLSDAISVYPTPMDCFFVVTAGEHAILFGLLQLGVSVY